MTTINSTSVNPTREDPEAAPSLGFLANGPSFSRGPVTAGSALRYHPVKNPAKPECKGRATAHV
jgi:hypothetical protein